MPRLFMRALLVATVLLALAAPATAADLPCAHHDVDAWRVHACAEDRNGDGDADTASAGATDASTAVSLYYLGYSSSGEEVLAAGAYDANVGLLYAQAYCVRDADGGCATAEVAAQLVTDDARQFAGAHVADGRFILCHAGASADGGAACDDLLS